MQDLIWIIAACSIGTFAVRFVPMWWRQNHQDQHIPQALERGLAALGYAAIVALVVASAWPQFAVAQPLLPVGRAVVAFIAIGVAHFIKKSIILSTTVGVLVFGLLQYFTAHG